ncbi:hypothetical protein QBC44DRAFT_378400 [Cladorrhinum sp. PSN332]|nr:hypothetical protein QBC44DRAFT_378400 [Cladorrhinum sp. PSN332]
MDALSSPLDCETCLCKVRLELKEEQATRDHDFLVGHPPPTTGMIQQRRNWTQRDVGTLGACELHYTSSFLPARFEGSFSATARPKSPSFLPTSSPDTQTENCSRHCSHLSAKNEQSCSIENSKILLLYHVNVFVPDVYSTTMSAISLQEPQSLDSRPTKLLNTTATLTGLGPAHTSSRLERLTDSRENHNLTVASIVTSVVQNIPLSLSILPSFITARPLTSTLGAITAIIVIMCSLTFLYHPCRHNRPFRVYCRDAVTRSEFLSLPRGRRSMLQRRPFSPSSSSQSSSSVPDNRLSRARSMSRSPPPTRRSHSVNSPRKGANPPSSPRMTPGRIIQNSREPHILCPKYRTVHTETLALCSKQDCHFERVNRCWQCCQCNRGPNRQSRCTSSTKHAGADGTTFRKKCKHDVCKDCKEYIFPPVPIYVPELGDWRKPPSSTAVIDAVPEKDGDTTESDEEEVDLTADLDDNGQMGG